MAILVIGEHHRGLLEKATGSVVQAARALDGDIHVLIASGEEPAAALAQQAAALAGVARVLSVAAAHLDAQLSEDVAAQVQKILEGGDYRYVLMSSSHAGRRILPYLAARCDTDLVTDAIAIEAADTFVRPVYAGGLWVVEKLKSVVKLLSVRASTFAPVAAQPATIMETLAAVPPVSAARLVECGEERSDRPDLSRARVVVGYGRGIARADLKAIETLAGALKAAIGATRAAVEEGLAPSDCMLGQTGRIIAPELYIAIGISGAIQHLAGVKDSKTIVAINKDPNAGIFQIADYGVVADARNAIPEMIEALA